jgi:hypothetical protein
VLTEDGVTGTGTGYSQSNAYSGGGNGVMGGFETLGNPVSATQMVYDHVARAIAPSFSGYVNSFPTIVNTGDQYTLNFSFILPSDWDENEIHIIGLLIDPQGRIDNAGKATISEAVSNGYISGSNAGLYENMANQLDETVKIYPNPASLFTTLGLNLKTTSNVEVAILDFSGKILTQKNYGLLNGIMNIPLYTNELSPGVYYINLNINGTKFQRKLIVE